MTSFSPQNKHYKQLKELCKRKSKANVGLFFNSNSKVVNYIVKKANHIIEQDKLVFEKIVPKEEHEWLINTFLKYNKQYFIDNSTRLVRDIELKLISTLKNMIEEEIVLKEKNQVSDSRKELREVIVDEDTGDYYPKSSFTFSSFMINAFYDNDVKYQFNKNIQTAKNSNYTNSLVTDKFVIISFLNTRKKYTKFSLICTRRKPEEENECGNVVYFNDIHEPSGIKCADSLPNSAFVESHTLKSLSKKMPEESIELYAYIVRPASALESTASEIIIHSPHKINNKVFEANLLLGGCGEDITNLIIAINEKDLSDLLPNEELIFLRDKNSLCFLDDAFVSIKAYLKKYHKIEAGNKGKIIAHFILLQLFANIFFEVLTKAAIFGSSGGGKTFWRKLLPPLITNSQHMVLGNDATRNRIIGGQPAKEDIMRIGSFIPGFVVTLDYFILEEMTDSLDEFYISKKTNRPVSQNAFIMTKAIESKFDEIDIGIQGSKPILPNASLLFFGNTENLSNISKDYRLKVRRYYGAIKPRFKENWPLYKQVEYYEKEMNNTALAKAHQKTREDLLPLNFVTYLPEAEQGRVALFIVLEEYNNDKGPDILDTVEYHEAVHTGQFVKELKSIFVFGTKKTERLNTKLMKSIREFMLKYIKQRNNFVIVSKKDYNRQLLSKLFELSTVFIIMNRLWFNKKPIKEDILDKQLTEDEKVILINRFYIYNYNTLDDKEAAMIKKPYVNDLYFNRNDLAEETFEKEEQDKLEKQAKQGININIEDEVFNRAEEIE